MTISHEERNKSYFDDFWRSGVELYERHPTGRHRRRFVLNALRKASRMSRCASAKLFDYGCGSGAVLGAAQRTLGLRECDLGGCDISGSAIQLARKRFPEGKFYEGAYPQLDAPVDFVICSEVIEHTDAYEEILSWIYANLSVGGWLVLTTPSVPMDPPDETYGHVQHFELDALVGLLRCVGFDVVSARRWGWPLFTLQKAITKRFHSAVESKVISKKPGPFVKALFLCAYFLYCVHDLLPYGPQIFILARRS